MTNERTTTLVLKDSAGSYYLVSQEMLEQGRIPADRAAEIESLLTVSGRSADGGEDTHGYFGPLALVFAGVILGGVAGGISIHRALSFQPEELYHPNLDFSHTGNEPIR